MPYINTIDVNGKIYTVGNLNNGYYTVDLPELKKNDIFILQGNVVDNLESSQPNKPLSAHQGKVLSEKIDAESQKLQDEDSEINKNLNNEISRATNKETELDTKIQTESKRAKDAESVLTTNLSTETTRAINKENDLDSKIDTETSRAKTAESELQTSISANKQSIDVINGSGEGSIAKALDDANNYTDTKDSTMNTRVKTIEDDYLKAADKTELSTSIKDVKDDVDAFLAAAETGDAAIDTLKEIQNYIDTHGEVASQMATNIGDNAKNIKSLQDAVGSDGATSTGLYKSIADVKTYADDTFIQKANIADNLTTNSSDKVLSAKQGRLLNDEKLNISGGTITGDLIINGVLGINDGSINGEKIKSSTITKAKLAQDVLTYIDETSTLITDNNWTYVKMRNGTAIAFGSFNYPNKTLTNGLNTDLSFSELYPSGLFLSNPVCIPKLYINGGVVLQYNIEIGTKDKTQTLGVCFLSGQSVSNITIYTDYIVIGKWK